MSITQRMHAAAADLRDAVDREYNSDAREYALDLLDVVEEFLAAHEQDEHWPVHIAVLQFLRDPDTDDPINWDWTSLLDQQHKVTYVTGGVLSHAHPERSTRSESTRSRRTP